MTRLVNTLVFWLGLLSLCNLVSVVVAMAFGMVGWQGLALFPVAWLLQLPFVGMVALVHFSFDWAACRLPKSVRNPVRILVGIVLCAVVLVVYAASQLMYFEIGVYISWDALQVAIDDVRQVLPDIWRGNQLELGLVALLSIAAGVIFVVWNSESSRSRTAGYRKVLVVLCAVAVAASIVVALGPQPSWVVNVRTGLLPTTCLAFSIVDAVRPDANSYGDAVADMVLQPCVSLDEFVAANPTAPTTNVFFILLEAITWNHMGFTGYERNVTPNIDALAEHCLVFPRSYAPANHSNYSQTSIHSSQYPLRKNHPDRYDTVDYPKTLLFDILSAAGYQTAFFSAQNEEWQGMKDFIFANTELQHFYHSKSELGEHIGPESKLDDALVRQRAVEFLHRRDHARPLFMYLNLQKTHFPYRLEEDVNRPFQPSSTDHFEFKFFSYDQRYVDHVVNRFDNALVYVDHQVGAFIAALKEMDLYDDSLIVVAADHGEAFYAHGYPTHGTSLYDDQMRTTTLFKLPGASQQEIRDDAISLIDINPTILEVLGLPNHPSFQGQPVAERARLGYIYLLSHGVIRSKGIVDYPWKYISSLRDGELLINVDLDPGERTDQSFRYPSKLKELKRELDVYEQRQLHYYTVLDAEDRNLLCPPRHFPAEGSERVPVGD